MEVILLERIENLGQMGDVVNVKAGYARNYLLRQKKALRATEENRKRFDDDRGQLEAENLDRRKEAEAVAKKLEGLAVTLLRQAAESAQLYGSVTARDIAQAVGEAGFTISRSQVNLGAAIKSLGLHSVRVALHPEVAVSISVNVARSAGEAEAQAKAGEAAEGTDVESFFEEEAREEAERSLSGEDDSKDAEGEAVGDGKAAADAEPGPADEPEADAPEEKPAE